MTIEFFRIGQIFEKIFLSVEVGGKTTANVCVGVIVYSKNK